MDKIDLPLQNRTERQNELHRQLLSIGKEIAAFYSDALKILSAEHLESRVNLLAHLAREIDGGLRDVFVLKTDSKVCDICGHETRIPSHLESICLALGVDKDNDLAKKWFYVATDFHKFSHRHGVWKTPREIEEFIPLWHKYEDVLFEVVGTYYRLLDRIDIVISNDSPTKEILQTLPNMFSVQAREQYFFSKLDKMGWLKPLNDAGFFNPENNPEPQKNSDKSGYIIPYWSALNFVERMAQRAQSNEEIDIIVGIVDKIIDYKKDGKRNNNSRTDYQCFKIIYLLPLSKLTKKHLDFIADSMVSDFYNSLIASDIGKVLIPKIVQEKDNRRLLEIIEIVTRYNIIEKGSINKVEPLVEEYWFEDIVNKNNQQIISVCGSELTSLLIDRIKEIKKIDSHSFNHVFIPTIEDHEQHSHLCIYETLLIKFLRNALLVTQFDELKLLIQKLLYDEGIIFRRLAFYIINQRYKELDEFLWNIDYNPTSIFECKHELYELFKNHVKEFNQGHISRIIEWIEFVKSSDANEDQSKKHIAYFRKEWYSSLLASEDKRIKENYEKNEKINPVLIEHAGFNSWVQAWYGDISPLQEPKLRSMESKAIAEYLINFKDEDCIRTPTSMGLAETLTKTVKSSPQSHSEGTQEYANIPMIYRHAILEGFSQAWNDKKEFNWRKVLDYILHTVRNETSIKDGRVGFDYYDWFIAQACKLIADGAKFDNHAFDANLLSVAKEILLLINTKVNFGKCGSEDYITFTLNSTKGKVLEAMLNYSLRFARASKNKIWDEDIQNVFDKELKSNPSIELHTILGQYIQNFLYINEEWLKNNVPIIFPRDNKELCHAALSGYFLNPTVYGKLYQIFRDSEIYNNALQRWQENPKYINERLVAHICLAYVEGWESIEDEKGLINLLLKEKETHKEIITFFSKNSEYLKLQNKSKIKTLWKTLYILNKDSDKTILNQLTKWLKIFDTLDDEIFEWSKEGLKYPRPTWESYHFIEALKKFVGTEPKKVGELFLLFIESSESLHNYKEEDVILIVQILYNKKEKMLADKICNMCGERGFHMLRETYKNNQ